MYITEDNRGKLVECLNKEMAKIIDHGELSKDTLHSLYEIIDILKDVGEVDEKEMNGMSQGMSYGHRMMPRNSYGSYGNPGMSYGNSYNSYGDDRGRMMDQWMNQATNEHERELVRRILGNM